MPWPNPTLTCTVTETDADGVTRTCPRPHAARGWCTTHYKRWQRTGDTGGLAPLRRGRPRLSADTSSSANAPAARERICEHPGGCSRPYVARGLCAPHHRRWLRTGDPGPAEIAAGGHRKYALGATCEADGCDRSVSARGLCKRHYERAAKPPPTPSARPECSRDGCAGAAESRGMCRSHYVAQFAAESAAESGRPECAAPGCPMAVYGQGLCRRHHEAETRERQRAARVGDSRRGADPRSANTAA